MDGVLIDDSSFVKFPAWRTIFESNRTDLASKRDFQKIFF